jgi:hypothetical protein
MLPAPASTAIPALADWVEASCLVGVSSRVSEPAVRSALQENGIDADDGTVSSIWLEMTNRGAVLGARYPFRVDGGSVRQRARADNPVYRLLLFLSIRASIQAATSRRVAQPTRLFERLVTDAAGAYIGGPSLRIGFPREGAVPRRFAELVPYLCARLKEGPPGPILNPADKDAGADVLAWKPFADERAGQVVLLAQCATGSNWKEKTVDCSVEEWKRYVGFAVTPVRVFAVPHVEPDSNLWLKYTLQGGVILDRLRLVGLVDVGLNGRLEESIRDWCADEGTRLAGIAAEAAA